MYMYMYTHKHMYMPRGLTLAYVTRLGTHVTGKKKYS